MKNLKVYWDNFNGVASGDWTPSFGIALIFGIILVACVGFTCLFFVIVAFAEFPWICIPLALIYVVGRLGYAAVKGK